MESDVMRDKPNFLSEKLWFGFILLNHGWNIGLTAHVDWRMVCFDCHISLLRKDCNTNVVDGMNSLYSEKENYFRAIFC